MYGVTITDIIKKMEFKNLTPELDTDKIVISHPDVNRPALQLTGFYDHFDNERVQIMGNVEMAYMAGLSKERRVEMYDKLISSKIPCIVFCRGVEPEEDILALCSHYGVPCLLSSKATSDVMAEVIRWLKAKLAPCISIHGVLVDVFGEGVTAVFKTCEAHSWGDGACTERRICSVCGEMECEARGHQAVTDASVAPTCTATGLTEGTHCSVCGETILAQGIVPALGHTEEIIPGKAAKCIETGLTMGKKCSVCGKTLTAQAVIPATDHVWDQGTVKVASTCTIAGIKTYVCTRDHAHTRTEALPVIEHADANEDGKCDTCKLQLSCVVIFDAKDGSPKPEKQITSPGSYLVEPETPVKKNHGFRGWFRSEEDSKPWDFTRDVVEENMTLYAQWYKNRHQIQGNIYQHNGGKPGRPIKLTLKLGNTVIYETQTDKNGFYEMIDIPAGTYNLVVEDPDGGSKTILVEVREDGKIKPIHLPEHNVSSELIVPDEDGNEIAVGGLDVVADEHHQGDTHVTVTMTAGKTEDITEEEPEDDDKKAQKEAQKAIKEQAKNNNGNGNGNGNQPEEEAREFVFLDIRIEKEEGDQSKEEITETSGLLEIRVPVETRGRRHFKVYRHHGNEVHELSEEPNAHGEYIEIHDGYVVIHARHFSMYAVTSQVCAHEMSTRYVWSAWGCEVIKECALCDDPVVETTETVRFWLEGDKLKLSHEIEGLHLLVAGYEGDRMISTQILTEPELENLVSVEGDTVKLFFLQADGSWQPLANARELR